MCSQTRPKMSPSYLLLVPQLSLTSPFLRLLRWWNVCTRPMQHLCQHLLQSKGLIFFNYIIAAELSWNSGEDLHIHTLPLSRGEEEEVTAEGSLTPVSGYELLLVNIHWYKHPLSWYIFFILYLLISIWQYQKSFKWPFQYFSEICFLRTFCLMCP